MKKLLRHGREKNSLNFRYVFGVPVQWSINFKFIVDKHTYFKLYINSPYPNENGVSTCVWSTMHRFSLPMLSQYALPL